MALSPNYGWAEPDNSSLVKNGAQDIRALGDAIDTSVWNVGYGQAGKNKIINGDFSINQRQFTSVTTTGTFGFDRFRISASDGTVTYTPQTFTTGTAPVAGYEGTNFARIVTTGQTLATARADLNTPIESVKTFAGQTVTVSFWAKCDVTSKKIAVEMVQNFGSGGSPSSTVNTYFGQVTLTTSWARYTVTGTVPSIAGKTIGTTANTSSLQLFLWNSAGSDYNARTGSIGIQNNTFDMWGIQVEEGSTVTDYQTATGTIQGELAACQRYYFKLPGSNNIFYAGFNNSTTEAYSAIPLPVTMRVRPTTTVTNAASGLAVRISGGTNVACNGTTSIIGNTLQNLWFSTTVASGLTAGQGSALINIGSAEAIEMSAEL